MKNKVNIELLEEAHEELRKVKNGLGVGDNEFIKFHALTTMKKMRNVIDELKEVSQ